MRIAVTGGEKMKEELMSEGIKDGTEIIWTNDQNELKMADASIDFNSCTVKITGRPVSMRFNGWPGFLKGKLVEVAVSGADDLEKAHQIFSCFNKKTESVPDVPGFISTRIVCMIINEAFFSLEENV